VVWMKKYSIILRISGPWTEWTVGTVLMAFF
jgi:hypothetical protein